MCKLHINSSKTLELKSWTEFVRFLNYQCKWKFELVKVELNFLGFMKYWSKWKFQFNSESQTSVNSVNKNKCHVQKAYSNLSNFCYETFSNVRYLEGEVCLHCNWIVVWCIFSDVSVTFVASYFTFKLIYFIYEQLNAYLQCYTKQV